MNPTEIAGLLDLVKELGIPGVVFILWYLSNRTATQVLNRYQTDMHEVRDMYKNNVKLVEAYASLASDLKDLVILNTEALTRACDGIERMEKTRGIPT